MKKTFIRDERFWTVTLGTAGCFALAWSLIQNPGNWPDIIVNFAQIGVAVIVFFIANNIFVNIVKKQKHGFNDKFEEYLKEWSELNKYLIDTTEIDNPKGNENKRSIQMICNHSNILNCDNASEMNSRKGSFLYLPRREELGNKKTSGDGSKIEFKINKSMFENNKDIFDNYEDKKTDLAGKIAMAIKVEFADFNNELSVSSKDDRIMIDFSKLEKTDENAKKLIDVVEFVKTVFLAIA